MLAAAAKKGAAKIVSTQSAGSAEGAGGGAGAPRLRRHAAHRARRPTQFDLAWSGDYNGLINGEINDKTVASGEGAAGHTQ